MSPMDLINYSPHHGVLVGCQASPSCTTPPRAEMDDGHLKYLYTGGAASSRAGAIARPTTLSGFHNSWSQYLKDRCR